MNTAKENTWRALTGDVQLMAWPCRVNWHRWTKWVEEEPHQFGGEWYIRSHRHCAGCNKREETIVRRRQFTTA